MAEPSLLEALGSPNLELLPPPAASGEWAARRNRLRAQLAAAGCHAHIRTPAALWAAAGVEGRPGRRWPQLEGVLLSTLAGRLNRPLTTSPIQLATWNARWLLSLHSGQGTRKRAFVQNLLLQGTVVALQETHWTTVSAALWGGLFPGASVAASATPGDEGTDPHTRPRGGVAIIAPQPFVLTDPRVLCPGYGLSATVTHPGSPDIIHIHNIYLPPDNRLATARLICEAMAASDPAPGLHFMTGDFNTQVGAPRGEVEAEVAAILEAAIARLNIHWTTAPHVPPRAPPHPTRRDSGALRARGILAGAGQVGARALRPRCLGGLAVCPRNHHWP